MRTLKQEEINARGYRSFAELQQNLEEFIEQIYNKVRLHSALDYRSPDEFEQSPESAGKWRPGVLNFFRHEEVRPDV
jgi:transposase InsO family protein